MAWTTPITFVTGDPLTAAELNANVRDNTQALKSPPTDSYIARQGTDYTTASAAFVDVDATNLSLTITTTGGDVLIGFYGTMANSVANQAAGFDVFVDAGAGFVAIAGLDGLIAQSNLSTIAIECISFMHLHTLVAGTYTFNLRWKTSGGTLRLYAGGTASPRDIRPQFWIREI